MFVVALRDSLPERGGLFGTIGLVGGILEAAGIMVIAVLLAIAACGSCRAGAGIRGKTALDSAPALLYLVNCNRI